MTFGSDESVLFRGVFNKGVLIEWFLISEYTIVAIETDESVLFIEVSL